MAVHRRKQAVTKTNEGGCRGGRARGEVGWTSLSISELHFQIGGPAAEPAGSTSAHHLSDCWELMAPALLLMNLFVSESASSAPSGGVLKQTCPLTRLPSSTSRPEENEKNTVKLKKKKAPTTISEAWKVISDRTCQGVYGRFTQSYEKERREPGD